MANECEETFKDAMHQILAETDRIITGPKCEEILDGFALLRCHAIVLQRKKTIRHFQETVLMRSGRVRNEIVRGIAGNNYLTFSDAREGREFRARCSGEKRPSNGSSRSSKQSKLPLEYTPSTQNLLAGTPETVLYTVTSPEMTEIPTLTQPGPNDLLFSTVMLFYHVSKTAQICYKTMSTKSEICEFLSLCLPNRCRKGKTVIETCKNANEYFKFASEKIPGYSLLWGRRGGVPCTVANFNSTPREGRSAQSTLFH